MMQDLDYLVSHHCRKKKQQKTTFYSPANIDRGLELAQSLSDPVQTFQYNDVNPRGSGHAAWHVEALIIR